MKAFQWLVMICFLGNLGFSMAPGALAADMAERHLFSPEADPSVVKESEAQVLKADSKELRKIRNRLDFSGIITTGGVRRALIKDKRNILNQHGSLRLVKGDTIMDLSVEEVGPNYVVLAGKGKSVRLNLFQGNKIRPKALPEPKVSASNNAKETPQKPAKSEKKSAAGDKPGEAAAKAARAASAAKAAEVRQQLKVKAQTKENNPFVNAIKKSSSAGISQSRGNLSTGGTNPFLEAIRRARENQE